MSAFSQMLGSTYILRGYSIRATIGMGDVADCILNTKIRAGKEGFNPFD